MSDVRLYLFDDARARRWAPFTLTRPVGELLFGTRTLRERAEGVWNAACSGHFSRAALAGFDEPGAAPTVALDDVPGDTTRVLVSSRAVLEPAEPPSLGQPARLTVAGEVVGWILPPGEPLPSEEEIREPDTAEAGARLEIDGAVLGGPWDLVGANPERIVADARLPDAAPDAPAIQRVGEGHVLLGAGAEVEPSVVVDTRGGPVLLDDGARVEGPGRLVGPLYVGRGSLVLGGVVGGSSIGPRCKIRGEVAESVVLGFSNKAHDGYLGHALVGRWVNLGAMTTNSDLKNTYGTVRVWTPDGEVDTGLMKVGCLVGDHVKTGIGTLLATGTVLGAGSNVYGVAMPPKVVPPFSWGTGAELGTYRLDKLLETAERAMARREQRLTPGVRRILEEAWHDTAPRRIA